MAPFWKFWGGGGASKRKSKTPSPPRDADRLTTAFIDHVKKSTPPWAPATPAETPVPTKKRKADAEVECVVKSKKSKSSKKSAPTKHAGAGEKVVGGKAATWTIDPADEMELFEGGLDDDILETTEVDPGFEDEGFEDDLVHGTDDIEPDDEDDQELNDEDNQDPGDEDIKDQEDDDDQDDQDQDDSDDYEDIEDILESAKAAEEEEEVIYVDVPTTKDAAEPSPADAPSAFDPSVFEQAEYDGSLIADVRARVGSFDAAFVPSDHLLSRGWPPDSLSLIKRLHQRGHEFLFPSHWQMDFWHLPSGLFLPKSAPVTKSFINSTRGKDFRATKALTRLIGLGPKARDKIVAGVGPETLIHRELERYMDWANYDSRNQFPDFPLLEIHSADSNTETEVMEHTLLTQLYRLHRRWQRTSHSSAKEGPEAMVGKASPTLYGALISHTLVGIVIYVPNGGEGNRGYLRSVGLFDFGVEGYDVWNALALALLVTHVRDVATRRGCGVQRKGKQRLSVARGLGIDPDS